MENNKLIKIVNNFPKKKIGVVGDLMLDEFISGNVERISPEAPIPVVLVNKENLIEHKGERALLNIDFQNYYFANLFAVTGGAYYLNTANKTPAESLKALKEIVVEPSSLALHFDPGVYRTKRIEEALMRCAEETPEEVVATTKRYMGAIY